jgi:hypothetical protein
MYITSILYILFLASVHSDVKETHNQSHSSIISSSYVSTYQDDGTGKPASHVRSMTTEEYRNKVNDKPVEVRKFGTLAKIDEGKDPEKNIAILKQKAATNVESEAKLLGNGEKVMELDEKAKKVNILIN